MENYIIYPVALIFFRLGFFSAKFSDQTFEIRSKGGRLLAKINVHQGSLQISNVHNFVTWNFKYATQFLENIGKFL